MQERGLGVAKAVALLVLAGMLVYANSLTKAFVFDDIPWIVNNRSLAAPAQNIQGILQTRPVVMLSLVLNYRLGGLNVTGYHAVNVAVHLGAALALFGLVRRTLLLDRWQGRYETSATWLAFAVALLWMVHPLQTQAVTYTIQRGESMMGFFYLLTLYCTLRGATTSSGSWWWYAAAVVSCALGVGSKEVMITAPVMVLLYDWVFLAGSVREMLRRRWGLYAALVSTYAVMTPSVLSGFLSPAEKASAGFAFKGFTPLDYLKTQTGVILYYLRLTFWPHPLCLDYLWPITHSWTAAILQGLPLVLLLLGTAWGLLRRSWLGFLGAWFFGILALTSSFMPIADVIVEHRMYLSLAAVLVLVVVSGDALLRALVARKWFSPRVGAVLGGSAVVLAAVVLGGLTVARNEDYRSLITIWQDTVNKRPDNPRAHLSLAVACMAQGDVEKALANCQAGLRINPMDPFGMANLGQCLARLGKFPEAITAGTRAVELRPWDDKLRFSLGEVLLRAGRAKEAEEQFRESLRGQPDLAVRHARLATALQAQGKRDEAAAEYAESLRLDPNWPASNVRLARQLLLKDERQPLDVREALFLTEEACQAEEADAERLDTLAIACAADGQFDKATATAKQALERATAAGQAELAKAIEARLWLYQKRRPFQRG